MNRRVDLEPVSWTPNLTTLTDPELVEAISHATARERQATAMVLRILIEFDRRQLYLAEGFPSLYAYCTQVLHYSEHAAFNRIEVARAAARWPQLLACLEDGSLHLAGARLLAPHLTEENLEFALESARFKTKREIEEVAAGLARRAVLAAVGAEQYRLHVTISREGRDALRQLRALLSHQMPELEDAAIVERALSLLLAHVQQQRTAATPNPRPPQAPRPGSRHIPASVKREVWARDGAQCAFVGRLGRCPERLFLEYHHVVPYAAGGTATAANVELRCRAHNQYEATMFYGAEVMAAARARKASQRDSNEPPGDPTGPTREGPQDQLAAADRGDVGTSEDAGADPPKASGAISGEPSAGEGASRPFDANGIGGPGARRIMGESQATSG